MTTNTAAKSRIRFPAWKPGQYVYLRNTSNEHITLNLPTGEFRLDAGRTWGFSADVLELEQVQQLLAAGKIEAQKTRKPLMPAR